MCHNAAIGLNGTKHVRLNHYEQQLVFDSIVQNASELWEGCSESHCALHTFATQCQNSMYAFPHQSCLRSVTAYMSRDLSRQEGKLVTFPRVALFKWRYTRQLLKHAFIEMDCSQTNNLWQIRVAHTVQH